MLTNADEPTMASSRHLLDDIDEVRFFRGPRGTKRRSRILELHLPDPRMSSDHGKLVRTSQGWVVHDPASKNGTLVDGAMTRQGVVGSGAVIELGHTFVTCGDGVVEASAPLDMVDGEGAIPAILTTFNGALTSSFTRLARVASTEVSVMLLGETGTGKERIARTLHELSGRSGPFVAVNCGALPPTLIESELFGHRRGAFTGALGDRPGLIRAAHGGTLFLDEIGELPPASQAAFLRVLQEREVVPVGDDRPVKVDVRLCTATLRDLTDLVDRGVFRSDLYARLFGLTVELAPLRDRSADFGIVLRSVLAGMPARAHIRFTCNALRAMVRHHWPLNIRELEKVVVTASALAGDLAIDVTHLDLARRTRAALPPRPPSRRDLRDIALCERLVGELSAARGNVVEVAKAMGVRRTQIYRWANRLDIDLSTFRRYESN
ncbi:MAG TPA: sigma 54-interacting transcriptional regulator [Kofleriaceae bacterium]|nr:sigma 54-interacting transcriptional regulator [Kofleriaceae bacterium]